MTAPITYKQNQVGAPAAVWQDVAALGWTSIMLPVVCDKSAEVSSNSTLKTLGKVPSAYNDQGKAVGFPAWTKHETTPEEIKRWSGNSRLGICVRTGFGVNAIDIDCDDPKIAQKAIKAVRSRFGKDILIRQREGSSHCLIPVRTEASLPKQVLHVNETNMVEILSRGQQFVLAGRHVSSDTPYELTQRLDDDHVPQCSEEDFKALVNDIRTAIGAETVRGRARPERRKGETALQEDRLADWLRETGRVLSEPRPGELQIVCPWEEQHTTGEAGDTSTTYYQAGTNGYPEGAFVCLHGHCKDKNLGDFKAWAKNQGFQETLPEDFHEAAPAAVEEPSPEAKFMAEFNDKDGRPKTSLAAVISALRLGYRFCGLEMSFDSFCGRTVVRKNSRDIWTEITDADEYSLKARLEHERGFHPAIAIGDLRGAIEVVAQENRRDSMTEYISRLPDWDGVHRVDTFFSTYCGSEDTEYTRAVAHYLFAAMAGRAISIRGVKADIVVVLVGRQGSRKSTLVRVLALEDRFSGNITFNSRDEDLARAIGGKLTVEIPELAGFRRREVEEVKRYITLTEDTWTPKYQEHAKTVPRRCIFVMTTNDDKFLVDTTGNRRFAPVRVGMIDIDRARADMPQLWAEALQIFLAEGIRHEPVERLSAKVNEEYMRIDPWTEKLEIWLSDPANLKDPMTGEDIPLTAANILELALGLRGSRVTTADARRLSACMTSLGYEYKRATTRVNGRRITLRFYAKAHERVAEAGLTDDEIPF